jgi:hypothetical protein
MAKKTKPQIKVTEDFMDSLVFSSCRYYIGRHTIAAHCAADELKQFLVKNPTCFSPDRRKFLANDIRGQINDQLRFSSNVDIDGWPSEGMIDALVLLARKVAEVLKESNMVLGTDDYRNPCVPGEFNPSKYDWHIDLNTKEVEFEETKNRGESRSYPINFRELVEDLAVWSALAQWLDPCLTVKAYFADLKIDSFGIEIPAVGRYAFEEHEHVEMHVVDAKTYEESALCNRFISPEFITEISYIR